MYIICPNCNAKYMIVDSAIGNGGRNVKCAKCHTVWMQTAKSAITEGAGEISRSPQLASNENTEPSNDSKFNSVLPSLSSGNISEFKYKWFVAASLLFLVFSLSLYFSNNILAAYPGLQRYYSVFNIDDNADISLQDVTINLVKDESTNKVLVSGKIANSSKIDKNMPIMKISLKGQNDELYGEISYAAGDSVLKSGQSVNFSKTIDEIPEGLENVIIDIGSKRDLAIRTAHAQ